MTYVHSANYKMETQTLSTSAHQGVAMAVRSGLWLGPSLAEIVAKHFKAKTRLCGNDVKWSTWTSLEKYWFWLIPPPRYGRPETDHFYMLRIDSRHSGTGFHYSDDPRKLVEWASRAMARERKLDVALNAARRGDDEAEIRSLELAHFMRWPITA